MAAQGTVLRSSLAGAALIFIVGFVPRAWSGQLGDLRKEVRRDSSSSSTSSSNKCSSNNDDDDDDSILGCILGALFSSSDDDCDHLSSTSSGSSSSSGNSSHKYGVLDATFDVVTAPWGLPHLLAGDEFDRVACFPDAPYDAGPGYLAIEPFVPEHYHHWGGHFRVEYADDFDDLSRIGGRLVLEHTSRLGLDTDWNYWQENLGSGQHDQLLTGDANVVFRFAQNERIAMRSGIGFNWLDDQRDTNYGFNFTYGLDYFPCKPWILSADIDWGTLGARGLFHGRATAGAIVGHAEVYVGYDYYDVGEVALNGIVAGVGVWF